MFNLAQRLLFGKNTYYMKTKCCCKFKSWQNQDYFEQPPIFIQAILLFSQQATRFFQELQPLDLILLLGGNPTSLRRNHCFSEEFFRACRRRLRSGGLLVLELPVADTYLGGAAGRLLAIMTSTLGQVFDDVVEQASEQPGLDERLDAKTTAGVPHAKASSGVSP